MVFSALARCLRLVLDTLRVPDVEVEVHFLVRKLRRSAWAA